MCTASVDNNRHNNKEIWYWVYNPFWRPKASSGTMFRHKDKYKTWQHRRSKHWHQLHHVVERQRDIQDVHPTRVIMREYNDAECWKDNGLIRTKLSLHIQASGRFEGSSTIQKLHINRFNDPAVCSKLSQIMDTALKRTSSLSKPDDDDTKEKREHLKDWSVCHCCKRLELQETP